MSRKHFTHEAFRTYAVTLDLLDCLCPVHKKEVLKVDAFRDLLNKTCQQKTGKMTKEGTPLNVEPGQLVTSVSELARGWKWHRDKVRDFVNELEEHDVLVIDMHKKFMVLSFPDLAERIAVFVAKNGNEDTDAPAETEPSTGGEDKGLTPHAEESSVTQDVPKPNNGATPKETETGTHTDGTDRVNTQPTPAKAGSYVQSTFFS